MSHPLGRRAPALADRIRSILAARRLSLAEVSRATRLLIPGNPLAHVPHHFYSSLRNRRISLSLYQVLALSTLSDCRLVDWLDVFGFSLDDVPCFHACLPALRTVELDSRIYQPNSSISWFRDLKRAVLSESLV